MDYAALRGPWPLVIAAVLATMATSPRAICTGLASGLVAPWTAGARADGPPEGD